MSDAEGAALDRLRSTFAHRQRLKHIEAELRNLRAENKQLRMVLGDLVSMYGDCPSHAMSEAKRLSGQQEVRSNE